MFVLAIHGFVLQIDVLNLWILQVGVQWRIVLHIDVFRVWILQVNVQWCRLGHKLRGAANPRHRAAAVLQQVQLPSSQQHGRLRPLQTSGTGSPSAFDACSRGHWRTTSQMWES